MGKEQEILEGINKIKNTILEGEERNKLAAQMGWIAGLFFISISMSFFAIMMQKLSSTTKYPLFTSGTLKIIFFVALGMFLISVILFINFLQKRNSSKSKTF